MTQRLLTASALTAMGMADYNRAANGKGTHSPGGESNPFSPYMAHGMSAGALGMYPGIGVPPPLLQSGVVPGELH